MFNQESAADTSVIPQPRRTTALSLTVPSINSSSSKKATTSTTGTIPTANKQSGDHPSSIAQPSTSPRQSDDDPLSLLGDSNFKQVQYSKNTKTFGGIGAIVLTVSVFFYMLLYRQNMFLASISMIHNMQDYRSAALDFLMNFISMSVNPNLVISLLVIVLALSTQKLKMLTFLLYYGMLVYLCTTMKSIFADPRPFWIQPPNFSSSSLFTSASQPSGRLLTTTTVTNDSSSAMPSQSPSISGQISGKKSHQNLLSLINRSNPQPETLSAYIPIISEFDQSKDALPHPDKQSTATQKPQTQTISNLRIATEQNLQTQAENQTTTTTTTSALPSVVPLDWKCYSEYGNPSGHSFLGVPLYEFIVRDYLLRKITNDQRVLRISIVIFGVVFINAILLSRMYLGMHSSNQVLFGVVLGISATILYRLFFERKISQMLYKFVSLARGQARQQILKVAFATGLAFTLPICLYAVQDHNVSQSPEEQSTWATNISLKCGKFDQFNSFHHKCFVDASVVAICFSIILGFLLTSRERFIKGQYSEAPGKKNFIYRVLVVFMCCVFAALAYAVFPFHAYPYLRYTSMFIGIFITGYLLVALVPILLEKYHLIQFNYPQDLSQKPQTQISMDQVASLYCPLRNSDL